jgi:predicted RNA-binding protein with PIN domain
MPYIIDGHNLIPKIPGVSLKAVDDEMQLIELLQDFCRASRKKVEVYFDRAPVGQMRVRKFGMVTARFVREGTTADLAIQQALKRLGREAHNWTVVSSDLAVQTYARAARAHYLSSEAFAAMLLDTLQGASQEGEEKREMPIDAQELEDWLRIFGSDEK